MMKFAGLLGLLFFVSNGFAQKTKEHKFEGIKIGDIKVSVELAKEYFVDLYINPDTISARELIMNKGPFQPSKVRWSGRKKTIIETIYKCDDWQEKGARSKQSLVNLIKLEGPVFWSTRTFYVLPREPSAIDFAHWMKSRKKK